MTIESYVKPEHNVAILVHSDKVQDDEFLTFYKSFLESDTFDPSMNLLIDLREADSRLRSSNTLHRFAEYMGTLKSDITAQTKVAVVAPKDISFGLARMYEFLSDSMPWDFVVFRAMDAALAWLGLPEDIKQIAKGDMPVD